MAFCLRYVLAFALVLGWATAPLAGADLAADKQQEVDALNESVNEAARLFQKGKYKDCAAAVRSVQQKCEALSSGGSPELTTALQSVYERLSKAHALLELEGISLPPLKKLETPAGEKAKESTPEELTAAREEAALKHWALALPGVPPMRAETKHFLLLGNVSQPTLQQTGERGESLLAKVGQFLAASPDKPLVKGRVTLFLLEKRQDYTQFGTQVEKQSPPAEGSGHWTSNGADAYGVSLVPRGDEYSLEALLVQQLAGLHVASLGTVPRWFAEGTARAAAAKLKPADARVKAWDQQLPAAVASLQRPDDFQTGKAQLESGDLASYSFIKRLMTDARRWRTLLEGVRSGKDFDATFSEAYGGSPAEVAEIWHKRVAGGRR